VFENGVLRRILGPKGEEVRREWRKLHNEELNDLYSSPTQYCSCNNIQKNDSGGTCSAYGGEKRRIVGFGGGNLKKRDHLGDPGLDGKLI
jgi:hypothetical protein